MTNFRNSLLLGLLLLTSAGFSAQCDIDFDFGDVEFGVSPDPAAGETFLDGMLDEDYFDVLQILIPATAAGIDSAYPPTLAVDSVIVLEDAVINDTTYAGVVFLDMATNELFHANEIGLEVVLNNNGDSPNGNTFLGGQQYCAAIQGIPNRSGHYMISIDIQAWATIFSPFNAPYTFTNFTLRVNCPVLAGVDVINANSVDGTQGELTAVLAEGVVATEIAWFNSFGVQIGTGETVTVDNPGSFTVQITTEDCVSVFGGWVVIDAGLDCTMTATVDVVHADEGEENGMASVTVEGATGPWNATWYNESGLLIGSGEGVDGLSPGMYSVLVLDSIGCSVEVEAIEVVTGLDELPGPAWRIFPNPADHSILISALPAGSQWALLSMEGKLLLDGLPREAESIDVSDFAPGMYVVRVTTSAGTQTRKVLIRR